VDRSARIPDENPEIRNSLESVKAANPTLVESANRQLDFIYQQSRLREQESLGYPIFRILG
jgi:hypothetical protein